MDLLQVVIERFEVFLLVLARISGMFFISPFFGNKSVPVKVKMIIALSVTIIALPLIPTPEKAVKGDIIEILLIVAQEVSFGAMLGFVANFIFMAMHVAGHVIGFQMGFAIVNVIDPATQTQVSIIAEFKYFMAMLIYLAINGHHFLISAVVQSFQLIAPGQMSFVQASGSLIARMSMNIFVIGMKIAAPAMITLFLVSLALGIIARTVPQMNVFIVGFPVKIAAGLMIIAAGLPYFGSLFSKFMTQMEADLTNLIILNAR
ncbi:MAG: flagellar type III secretion system protein FliR [candidate division Zixibacteria bacterium]|nr:flagellar type III secretion system protein FliR [candidate division Zixibacteria bacterium]